MQFLTRHWGTILVLLALVCVVAAIVRKLIRDKKKGIGACGNRCGGCPMNGACHRQ